MTENKGFSSNFGAIMAAVGSAVGLGNIWRFPYICGKYGGGAFLIVYLCFVFCIGMVLMMTEFVIGRRSQHTPVAAYPILRPDKKGWRYVGIFGMVTCFLILSLYLVISGWTLNYVVDAASGTLAQLDSSGLELHFKAFSESAVRPIVFLAVFALLTVAVILGGVQKGVEKVSKLMMPILVVLLVVLCVRSVTMPGASAGLDYLFKPDFSKLTGQGVLAALGQALFSLSVGMGVMIVYGSYIPRNDNLLKTSIWITVCDTLIALCAGVAIFPAVFSCGLEPTGGPGLVFKVLPTVFNSMNPSSGFMVGTVFSVIFFVLLSMAALTSAISLLEALVAWGSEYPNRKRSVSAIVLALCVVVLGGLCSMSVGGLSGVKVAGLGLFDLVDKLTAVYLPPLCALLTVAFIGWVMPAADIKDELSNHGTLKVGYFKAFYFLARYVAPLALLLVLVTGIVNG
ncbi:MAG: sodium-dependent transporter [Bacteroidales bacterium]|nr:sodium-dependent transporter [Bacteroidales bacterium]